MKFGKLSMQLHYNKVNVRADVQLSGLIKMCMQMFRALAITAILLTEGQAYNYYFIRLFLYQVKCCRAE